ncbi:MAG: AI-2E family transporter [Rhodospirillales bacterium]|nr:AI-2E family transporter [Rhodospirillales bacterium]
MTLGAYSSADRIFVRRAVEAAIRVGLLALLVIWCFQIVQPFIIPFVWGVIIAVAVYPLFEQLRSAFGNRSTLTAVVFTILMLVLLIWPAALLATTLVEGVHALVLGFAEGKIAIPPPFEGVARWPVIGERIARFWLLASENLADALGEIRPQIAFVSRWLLSAAADASLGILQFAAAVVIAGVLMAHGKGGGDMVHAIAARLAGESGKAYAEIGQATVRSVARGILGVALIQSLLAGLGFLAVGIPAAGLLALICLLLAVVQIGPGLVLIGAVIWVFSEATTPVAVAFLVWCLFVGLLDNFLKPLLLGRGVRVPMVVIFVGAIGGLLASGIIGLFVGAVVLAVGFTIFTAWLGHAPASAGGEVLGAADVASGDYPSLSTGRD